MTPDTKPPVDQLDAARLHVYRFLALAAADPRSARWNRLLEADAQEAAVAAARCLASDPRCQPPALAPGEAPPAGLDLAPLVAALRARAGDVNDEYERVFGLMLAKKCPPYETEYCPQTFSVYRSQALADVAGFYRAFGVGPSRDAPERADHVSLELEFMAYLVAKEQTAADPVQRGICRDAQRRFAREHLCWWVPAFARALEKQSMRVTGDAARDSGFYPALSRALAALVAAERAALAIDPPTELVAPGPVEPPEEMTCQGCAFHDAAAAGAGAAAGERITSSRASPVPWPHHGAL